MGMSKTELAAVKALAECIGATGKAVAKVVGVLGEELPGLKPQLSAVMEELIRDLNTAALLLPE